MKKLFCILVSAVLCIAFISCTDTPEATPNDIEADIPEAVTPNEQEITEPEIIESPITDFQYELNASKRCVYITKYIGTSEKVVIPAKIEGLPVRLSSTYNENNEYEGVFEGSKVKTVVMTEISTIDVNTFKNCEELTEVIVSDKLKVLQHGAFDNCKKLERIDISNTGVLRIGAYAFRNCVNLKKLDLPDCLLEIDNNAFYGCKSLEEMHLPEGLIMIRNDAFVNCTALKRINIPANVVLHYPDRPVFDNTALEVVEFDSGREIVDGYAYFNFNNNYCNVVIPETVKDFHENMFSANVTFTFLGNSPTINKSTLLYGNTKRIIYYDINTEGWDDWEWKNHFTLIPKK